MLPKLSDADLLAMGIDKLGDRKRVLEASAVPTPNAGVAALSGLDRALLVVRSGLGLAFAFCFLIIFGTCGYCMCAVIDGAAGGWDAERKCATSQSGCIRHCIDVGKGSPQFCDSSWCTTSSDYCPGAFEKIIEDEERQRKETRKRYGE
jgi:hypothetical protein